MEPKCPLLATDVIIQMPDDKIVIIERKYEPLGFALPGGHVEVGETVEQAAIREMKEETNLDVELLDIIGVFSDPKRDPRRHVVSVAFLGRATGKPKAGDDAKNVKLYNIEDVPPLMFDHNEIIRTWQGTYCPYCGERHSAGCIAGGRCLQCGTMLTSLK